MLYPNYPVARCIGNLHFRWELKCIFSNKFVLPMWEAMTHYQPSRECAKVRTHKCDLYDGLVFCCDSCSNESMLGILKRRGYFLWWVISRQFHSLIPPCPDWWNYIFVEWENRSRHFSVARPTWQFFSRIFCAGVMHTAKFAQLQWELFLESMARLVHSGHENVSQEWQDLGAWT